VQAVALDAQAHTCATSSWDTTIRVWDVQAALADAEAEGGRKRRKTAADSAACMSAPHVESESRATLEGHSQVVSGLAWPTAHGGSHLLSGSWDHTLKRWDVARAVCVQTISTGKAVQCVAAWAASGDVLACGASDGTLRLWDVRGSSEQLVRRSCGWLCVCNLNARADSAPRPRRLSRRTSRTAASCPA